MAVDNPYGVHQSKLKISLMIIVANDVPRFQKAQVIHKHPERKLAFYGVRTWARRTLKVRLSSLAKATEEPWPSICFHPKLFSRAEKKISRVGLLFL